MAKKAVKTEKIEEATPSQEVAQPSVINKYANKEGLRALRLEIENFKGIKSMIVDIGGRSMLVMGKNNAGKSTVIQAMMSPLNSKLLPSDPITQGEEKAKISFTFGGSVHGEYKQYTADLRFSQANKEGTLTVLNENNEKIKSPATIIKGYLSSSSFDITAWLQEKKEKRLELLKNLTGRGKDIDLINMEIKSMKDQKKMKNDRAEELEGSLNNHGFEPHEIDKYSTPVIITDLQAEFNVTVENQQLWDNVNNQLNNLHTSIQHSQSSIQRARDEKVRITAEISRLNDLLIAQDNTINIESQRITETQNTILGGEEWLRNAGPRPSLDSINQRMSEAGAHNEKNLRIGQLAIQQQEMIKLKQEVEQYKPLIEAKETERNNIIASSQLPVPGLSFTDEEIFLNGLPFEAEQINTATRFDVGAEIAMALNPGLKLIFIHDGSLFDQEHLRAIISKIESRGYQAIVELVAENEEVEARFIETELN